jgi:hypothetical protein
MIKRLIDESSELTVNSVNSHIIKKILNSGAIDHIFCNRSSFITYTLKISICETGTGKKFTSEGYESVAMILINGDNQARDVTLTEVLYSSQLQYNLISITKLVRKEVETFLRLSYQLSQLILGDDVIAVVEMINDQYVLREKSSINPRALVNQGPIIETWHARLRHLGYDNLIKLQNQAIEMTLNESKSDQICGPCMIGRQERNINKTSRIRVTKFLEIVHFDLRESMPRIRNNFAYYMLFRDD